MKVENIKVGYLEENCYVISSENECLVVDPGDEFDKIKKLIGNKKVLACLITHYHFDHIGCIDDIKKEYNCNIIDYKNDKLQTIGPFSFEIIENKGHTNDSVSFYFKDENIMFVGDFIFKETIGRCDLKGGDFNEMLKSLENLKKYDDNIILYPGHNESTTIGYEKKNNIYLNGGCYE